MSVCWGMASIWIGGSQHRPHITAQHIYLIWCTKFLLFLLVKQHTIVIFQWKWVASWFGELCMFKFSCLGSKLIQHLWSHRSIQYKGPVSKNLKLETLSCFKAKLFLSKLPIFPQSQIGLFVYGKSMNSVVVALRWSKACSHGEQVCNILLFPVSLRYMWWFPNDICLCRGV